MLSVHTLEPSPGVIVLGYSGILIDVSLHWPQSWGLILHVEWTGANQRWFLNRGRPDPFSE